MASAAPEVLVQLEDSMVSAMLPPLRKEVREWTRRVGRLVNSGDLSGAKTEAESLDVTGSYRKSEKRIRKLSKASALFGAGRLVTKTPLADFDKDDTFQAGLRLAEAMQVRYNLWGRLLMGRMIDLFETETEKQKSESILKDFVSFAGGKAETLAENHTRLVASLHNSRLASYGFALEATIRGLEFYAINAVLDDRTSDICEILNGKVFSVERALNLTTDLLNTEDPEDLKRKAPWPTNVPDLAELSASELMDRGFFVPPFHPYCRTFIDRVEGITPMDHVPTTTGSRELLVDSVTEKPHVSEALLDRLTQNQPTTTREDALTTLGVRGYLSARANVIAETVDLASLGTAALVGILVVNAFEDSNLATDEIEAVLDDLDSGMADVDIMSKYAISLQELNYIREAYELYG